MTNDTSSRPEPPPRAVSSRPPLLQSIKIRILVFALAATIIPAITLGSLSYLQNTRFLSEKIAQELRDATSQVSREIDLLIKEKLYDVRVFASSYIVSENLVKILNTDGPDVENLMAMSLIEEYLQSVRAKFSDYVELIILDLEGRLIATSAATHENATLPAGWREKMSGGQAVLGNATYDEVLKTSVILIADPIRSPGGGIIGVLGAKLSLDALDRVLADYTQTDTRETYLVNQQGKLLASSHLFTSPSRDVYLKHAVATKLFDHLGSPVTYTSYKGQTVIGTVKEVSSLGWGVVAEMDKTRAFAQIEAIQRITLVLVGGLLVGIGLCAYFLGTTIVRPLRRLSRGADQVATGNLDVDLPVHTQSEVGYLTQVFNHMVGRLRSSREELDSVNAELQEKNRELHQLSITDELTGLYNRKHLMETMRAEVSRSKRNHHTFALLVIDIDHFKRINDTFGHQKGDEVLHLLGGVFRDTVRSCDYVARYGGEEFILILPELGAGGGLEVAERIRERVAQERINPKGDRITVSIGMAMFAEHGDSPEELFQKADQALYAAKRGGRNRVVPATGRAEPPLLEPGPIRLVTPQKRESGN
jgi:diguanylate cyclase (GGDEF)-like protein